MTFKPALHRTKAKKCDDVNSTKVQLHSSISTCQLAFGSSGNCLIDHNVEQDGEVQIFRKKSPAQTNCCKKFNSSFKESCFQIARDLL